MQTPFLSGVYGGMHVVDEIVLNRHTGYPYSFQDVNAEAMWYNGDSKTAIRRSIFL